MKVEFLRKFSKDLLKITHKKDKKLVLDAINLVKELKDLKNFPPNSLSYNKKQVHPTAGRTA